jgi:hypothetical protein
MPHTQLASQGGPALRSSGIMLRRARAARLVTIGGGRNCGGCLLQAVTRAVQHCPGALERAPLVLWPLPWLHELRAARWCRFRRTAERAAARRALAAPAAAGRWGPG